MCVVELMLKPKRGTDTEIQPFCLSSNIYAFNFYEQIFTISWDSDS